MREEGEQPSAPAPRPATRRERPVPALFGRKNEPQTEE
jgi:hypothetical protein